MSGDRTSGFAATRWTLVNRARVDSDEGRLAMSELCEAYWTPVYRFLLAEGRKEDDARELTQEFFSQLLAGNRVLGATETKGRFRSYLLGAVKHFLAAERRAAGRLKRGGGVSVRSLDGDSAGGVLEVADDSQMPDDAYFDRHWAYALLDLAMGDLQAEMEGKGQAEMFATLKPWLIGKARQKQEEAAAALGMSPGAVKVAIHRMRRRFKDSVKSQIAHTVEKEEEIATELLYLLEVLSKSQREE